MPEDDAEVVAANGTLVRQSGPDRLTSHQRTLPVTRTLVTIAPATSYGDEETMGRPVTLFTGQWADLTLEELAGKCADWGFDGLELACWGDHFDVAEAMRDKGYCAGRRELLERSGLGVWAIGNHLVG